MKTAANLALPGIAHGFFGRAGGVSGGLYESLNCGPGSRDDPAAVAENRRRVAAALGARALVSLAQIHSPFAHMIAPGWDFSRRAEGDGLATATPGVALGILTADCAPVLLADGAARVIGAAHAGWKGAFGGVLEATLAAMEALGARREQVAAAIGPAISKANYEVRAEFRDRFLAGGPDAEQFFSAAGRPGHYRFDLPLYVGWRLAQAGVAAIARLDLCTYPAASGYFSFRRATHLGEADYGREISAIVIAP